MASRRRIESGQTTGLGSGYAKARRSGVGVVPGAHPEFDNPPKAAKPKEPKWKDTGMGTQTLSTIQEKIRERKAQNAGARALTREMGRK